MLQASDKSVFASVLSVSYCGDWDGLVLVLKQPNTNGHSTWIQQLRCPANGLTINLGIFLTFSSFRMEHLVDVRCNDILLVTEVLGTFCVQGRSRLESLDIAIEQEDLSSAMFDAVRCEILI